MERGLYVWGMGIESKIKLNTLTKTESLRLSVYLVRGPVVEDLV